MLVTGRTARVLPLNDGHADVRACFPDDRGREGLEAPASHGGESGWPSGQGAQTPIRRCLDGSGGWLGFRSQGHPARCRMTLTLVG